MNLSELGIRIFIMMDSDTEFPGHAGAVFVLFILGYVQLFIRKLLDCKMKMHNYRHPGGLCLTGKRIDLPALGRLGAVSAPQKGVTIWERQRSLRGQGRMQKRGIARWAGGQRRLDEKRQKLLNFFEHSSKVLRNITLTTR